MSGDWREKLRRGQGRPLHEVGVPSTPLISNIDDLLSTTTGEEGQIESFDFLVKKLALKNQFIPKIDFSDPSNFVKFGSAKKYYEDSIARVYKTYPYDGSHEDKITWELSSSYLDSYIYTYEYPRQTGYITLASPTWTKTAGTAKYGAQQTPEYIYFSGGPHADPDGDFKKGTPNKYDEINKRVSNLAVERSSGNTVEFWLKKSAAADSNNQTQREVFFDCFSPSHNEENSKHFRMMIELDTTDTSSWLITCRSGVVGSHVGVVEEKIGRSASIVGPSWNHHAFSFEYGTTDDYITLKYYNNGEVNDTKKIVLSSGFFAGYVDDDSLPYNTIAVPLAASIGALGFAHSTSPAGSGQIFGSIDEFRYWKEIRTAKEVGLNYIRPVHGGTNVSLANVELGVYYKFNEGITGNNLLDEIVLDYSGRISNGKIHGYNTSTRSLNSAIKEATEGAAEETPDPVLHESHPDLVALLKDKRQVGEYYDYTNGASILNTLPSWLLEEQSTSSKGFQTLLADLTQIIASYFDTIFFQINELPKLKGIVYDEYSGRQLEGSKPYPFMDKILSSFSFDTTEIFADLKLEEKFLDRTDRTVFQKDISEIKNFIFKNIYNNLVLLYKTKGTEASFRNFIRCLGIGEEVLDIVTYADNYKHKFIDTFSQTVSRHRAINFRNEAYFNASIHQYTDAAGLIFGHRDYVPGVSTAGQSHTFEANISFPEMINAETFDSAQLSVITSSIFGLKTPEKIDNHVTDAADLTVDNTGNADLGLYAVKNLNWGSFENIKFHLSSSVTGMPTLTSPLFQEVYKDKSWNVATILRPAGAKWGSLASGSTDQYDLIMRGYSYISDIVDESFEVSASVTKQVAENFLAANKRFYIGANKENFTGSTIHQSDVKIESFRAYASELTAEDQKHHARDFNIFGQNSAASDVNLMISGGDNVDLPRYATNYLHWSFDTVESSDAAGKFETHDLSSRRSGYGYMDDVFSNEYPGHGHGFGVNNTSFLSGFYRPTAKQSIPETVHKTELVKMGIAEEGHEIFEKSTRPIVRFYTFEKSMYKAVAHQMLNFVASVDAFNDLIGDPINKYRAEYKDLTKLRQFFFSFVDSDLDLEKYLTYYRWLDTSISVMIDQLKPATVQFSEDIRNMIESHMFERNKYEHKFPTIELEPPVIEGPALGINEMLYDYEHGRAPIPTKAVAVDILDFTSQALNDEFTVTVPSSVDGTGAAITVKLVSNVSSPPANTVYVYRHGSNNDDTVAQRVNAAFNGSSDSNWNTHQSNITYGSGIQGASTGIDGVGSTRSVNKLTLTIVRAGVDGNSAALANVAGTRFQSVSFTGGSGGQDDNCLWWKDRAERNEESTDNIAYLISSSVEPVNDNREDLRKFINAEVTGSTYVLRKLTKPYRFSADRRLGLFAGDNFSRANKRRGLLDSNLYLGALGDDGLTPAIILKKEDIEVQKDCNDIVNPDLKNTINAKASSNLGGSYADIDSDFLMPFQVMSGAITGDPLESFGVHISNLHTDGYTIENEIPMQGVFARQHVGGWAHRNIPVGQLVSEGARFDRPEKFKINIDTTSLRVNPVAGPVTGDDGNINVYQRSIYTRDGMSKRPFNIKNIKSSTTQSFPVAAASVATIKILTDNPADLAGHILDIGRRTWNTNKNVPALCYFTATEADGDTGTQGNSALGGLGSSCSVWNGSCERALVQLYGLNSASDIAAQLKIAIESNASDTVEVYISGAELTLEYRETGAQNNSDHLPGWPGQTSHMATTTWHGGTNGSSEEGILGTYQPLGNYMADYEIVQVSDANNRALVDHVESGNVEDDGTQQYLQGVTDFFHVTQSKSEHMMSNRFSRPGGAGSRLNYLHDPFDPNGYSPYNTIAYANLRARDRLNKLYTEYTEQFGGRSGSIGREGDYQLSHRTDLHADAHRRPSVAASIHMTNKNVRYQPAFDGTKSDPRPPDWTTSNWAAASPVPSPLAKKHDNFFVQHQIPQSDLQYRWIAASTDLNTSSFFGFESNYSLPSGENSSIYNTLTFISSSEFGIAINKAYADTIYLEVGNELSEEIDWIILGAHGDSVEGDKEEYRDDGTVPLYDSPLSLSSSLNSTTGVPFTYMPIDRAGLNQIMLQNKLADHSNPYINSNVLNEYKPSFNPMDNNPKLVKSVIRSDTVPPFTSSISYYEATPYTVVERHFNTGDEGHFLDKDVKAANGDPWPHDSEYYNNIYIHLNSYLLNKGSGYGWNPWNQLRSSHNLLSRNNRKNNYLSFWAGDSRRVMTLTEFKEPAVTFSEDRFSTPLYSYLLPGVPDILASSVRPFVGQSRTLQTTNAAKTNLWAKSNSSQTPVLLAQGQPWPDRPVDSWQDRSNREHIHKATWWRGYNRIERSTEGENEGNIDGVWDPNKEETTFYLGRAHPHEVIFNHAIQDPFLQLEPVEELDDQLLDFQGVTLRGRYPQASNQYNNFFINLYANSDLNRFLKTAHGSPFAPPPTIENYKKNKLERDVLLWSQSTNDRLLVPSGQYYYINVGIYPARENRTFARTRKRENFTSSFWAEDGLRDFDLDFVSYFPLSSSNADYGFFSGSGFYSASHDTVDLQVRPQSSMGVDSVDYGFYFRTNNQDPPSPDDAQDPATGADPFGYIPWGGPSEDNAASGSITQEELKIRQSIWPLDGRRNLLYTEFSDSIDGLFEQPINSYYPDRYVWSFKDVKSPLYTSYTVEQQSFRRSPGENGQDYVYLRHADPNGSPLVSDRHIVSFLGTPMISYTSPFPDPFLKNTSDKEDRYYFKYTNVFYAEDQTKLAGSPARFELDAPFSSAAGAFNNSKYLNDMTEWSVHSSSLDTRSRRGEGELQNDYCIYHMGSSNIHVVAPPAMLYSRRVPQTIYKVEPEFSKSTITISADVTGADLNGDEITVVDARGTSVTYAFSNAAAAAGMGPLVIDVSSANTVALVASEIKSAINYPNIDLEITAALPINQGSAATHIHTIELTQNIAGTRGNRSIQFNPVTAHIGATRFASTKKYSTPDNSGIRGFQVLAGDAKWEVNQSDPNPYASTPRPPKEPFYGSYEDFRENIQGLDQNYSIVPEFKSSDFIQEMISGRTLAEMVDEGEDIPAGRGPVDDDNNQYSLLTRYLQNREEDGLEGFSYEGFSTPPVSGVDPAGYASLKRMYTTSELSSSFGIFLDSIAGSEPGSLFEDNPMNVHSVTLRAKGILKLLPYEGFYPATRAIQIGSIFKDDYVSTPFTEDAVGDATTATERDILMKLKVSSSINPIIKPLFSPGILFNSIKSGLGVDYPIFRNANTGALGHYAISQNSIGTPYVNYFINSLIPTTDGTNLFTSATRLENTASYSSGLGLSPVDDDRKVKILGTHQRFLYNNNFQFDPAGVLARGLISHDLDAGDADEPVVMADPTDSNRIMALLGNAVAHGSIQDPPIAADAYRTIEVDLSFDTAVNIGFTVYAAANSNDIYSLDPPTTDMDMWFQYSINDGTNWTTIAQFKGSDTKYRGTFIPVGYQELDHGTAAAPMTLRWISRTNDDENNHWALDNLLITEYRAQAYGEAITGSFLNDTEDAGVPRLKPTTDTVHRIPFEALYEPRRLESREYACDANNDCPVIDGIQYVCVQQNQDPALPSRCEHPNVNGRDRHHKWLRRFAMYDNEPHPSASFCFGGYNHWKVMEYPYEYGSFSTAEMQKKWQFEGGRPRASMKSYKLAINNFLAESVDTFLESGLMTSFRSSPRGQWTFLHGKRYGMRLYLRNENSSMYDRHSAFGPPVDSVKNYHEEESLDTTIPATYDYLTLTSSLANVSPKTRITLCGGSNQGCGFTPSPNLVTEFMRPNSASALGLAEAKVILKTEGVAYVYQFKDAATAGHYEDEIIGTGATQKIYEDLADGGAANGTHNNGGTRTTAVNAPALDADGTWANSRGSILKASDLTVGSSSGFANATDQPFAAANLSGPDRGLTGTYSCSGGTVTITSIVEPGQGFTVADTLTFTDPSDDSGTVVLTVAKVHKVRRRYIGYKQGTTKLSEVFAELEYKISQQIAYWAAQDKFEGIPTNTYLPELSFLTGQKLEMYIPNGLNVHEFLGKDSKFNSIIFTVLDKTGTPATTTMAGNSFQGFQFNNTNATPQTLSLTQTTSNLTANTVYVTVPKLIADDDTPHLTAGSKTCRVGIALKADRNYVAASNIADPTFTGGSGNSPIWNIWISPDQHPSAEDESTAALEGAGGYLRRSTYFKQIADAINGLSNKIFLTASFIENYKGLDPGVDHSYNPRLYIRATEVGRDALRQVSVPTSMAINSYIGPEDEDNRNSATVLNFLGGSSSSVIREQINPQPLHAYDPYVPPYLNPRPAPDRHPFIDILVDYSDLEPADVPAARLKDPEFMASLTTIRYENGTPSAGSGEYRSQSGPARDLAMTLSSSLDPMIFVPEEIPEDFGIEAISTFNDVWAIAPKWETPILDFRSSEQSVQKITRTQGASTDTTVADIGFYKLETKVISSTLGSPSPYAGTNPHEMWITSSRGMWHQRGHWNGGYTMSLEPPVGAGVEDLRRAVGFPEDIQASKTLGKPKESTELAEAIVLIPYYEAIVGNNTETSWVSMPFLKTLANAIPGRAAEGDVLKLTSDDFHAHYIDTLNTPIGEFQAGNNDARHAPQVIPGGHHPAALNDVLIPKPDMVNAARLSYGIQNQIELMNEFVMPPQYDFLRNPADVGDTITMFILPFYHKLDQNDIVDWWQNIPPDIAYNPQVKESHATHLTYPIKTTVIPGAQQPDQWPVDFDEINGHPAIVAMSLYDDTGNPRKIMWKVFKVKKRAKKSFFNKKLSSYMGRDLDGTLLGRVIEQVNIAEDLESGEARSTFGKDEVKNLVNTFKGLTWNWPYDYFSLVELINVDARFGLEGTSEDNKQAVDPDARINEFGIYDEYGLSRKFVDAVLDTVLLGD